MEFQYGEEERLLDLADELFDRGDYQESLRIYLDLEESTDSSDLEESEGLDYCLYLWMKIAKAYWGLGELEKSRDYCINPDFAFESSAFGIGGGAADSGEDGSQD